MKILFCGGGTAGHVSPSIALAEELVGAGHEVAFFGRADGRENKIINTHGYKLYTAKLHGLSLSPIKLLKSLIETSRAICISKNIMKEFAPDVIFATGGYVSYPVLKAAISIKIPTILHESNAVSGRVTRLLSKKCTRLLLGGEDIKYHLENLGNAEITGTPVRGGFEKYTKSEARKRLCIGDDEFFIVSLGGSLGAKAINNSAVGLMKELMTIGSNVRHYHSAGARYYELISKSEPGLVKPYGKFRIFPYIDDMPLYLSAADLAISRAGAVSIAEISVSQTPSILIPSPNVTDDHQSANAKRLAGLGGCVIIPEEELTDKLLLEKCKIFLNDISLRNQFKNNLKKSPDIGARERIISIFHEAVK